MVGQGFHRLEQCQGSDAEYDGHYQPRVPLDENYYDQSQLAILRSQVELAKRYGVYGFCHYHYWFDGKQLLETPTNLMLANRDIDFPFCLSWANETWSRRWNGRGRHILIQQTHPPVRERWKLHYDYLIKAWTDPRAIKVDGKPVFVIYRPHLIEQIDDMLAYWRELAVKDGLPGLYFIFQQQGYYMGEFPYSNCLKSFDALFQFQPFESVTSPTYKRNSLKHLLLFRLVRSLPERYQNVIRDIRASFSSGHTVYDYDATWARIVKVRPNPTLTTFPGAFVDWDNTSRYKKRATIFRGATPEKFAAWFGKLVDSMPQRNLPENYIFLNAWNEWSECAYLEPDERYGYRYLEAVSEALNKF